MSAKESSLQVFDIPIGDIVPNPDNINEMSQKTLDRLVQEIRDVGFIAPCQVVPLEDGKYKLLGGEHRWRAAGIAGMTYVPCVVLTETKWTDQDVFDLTAFRLNVIRGSQSPEKFLRLYERLATKHGAESLQDVFAVTDQGLWKKLTKQIAKASEHSPEIAEVAKTAKTPEDFSKKLKKVLKDYEAGLKDSGALVVTADDMPTIVLRLDLPIYEKLKKLIDSVPSGKTFSSVLDGVLP